MLTKQQETTNQINKLLQQTSQSLLCGPGTECEKTRNSEDLQQKYLDSQTNLQSSPYQEKQAEKNYYTYTQGEPAYNDMIRERLVKEAEKKTNDMLVNFNQNVKKATQLNATLSSLTIDYEHILELYKNYLEENEILNNKIISFGTDLVTNDRKTYYEDQNYDILVGWYSIWRWIYFILLIVFALGIFLSKSSYSIWAKLGLLGVLILYPYFINYLVFYLLKIILNIQSLLPKNVYNSL
jgi:hypothetical protein